MTAKSRLARAKCHTRSRGATLFVIAMTLAVLSSLGAFAIIAASSEIRTSGYERQSAQTHYLSEYGVLGGAQGLSSVNAQVYLELMLGDRRDVSCASLVGVNQSDTSLPATTRACRRVGSAELSAGWSTGQAFVTQTNNHSGSLGPFPLRPDFYVEITDPTPAARPPGYDTSLGVCFVRFTMTATGITGPVSTDSTTTYAGEGVEAARARVVAGPSVCTP